LEARHLVGVIQGCRNYYYYYYYYCAAGSVTRSPAPMGDKEPEVHPEKAVHPFNLMALAFNGVRFSSL